MSLRVQVGRRNNNNLNGVGDKPLQVLKIM
jgi:hypothetical protein